VIPLVGRTVYAVLGLLILCLTCEAVFAQPEVEIEIKGNALLGRGKILEVVGLQAYPTDASPEAWEGWAEDAAALVLEHYQNMGFFMVKASVSPKIDAIGDSLVAAKVSFDISEGARFRFRDVRIESAKTRPPISVDELRCRKGRTFDRELMSKDRRDILRAFGNAGFLHAKAGESLRLDSAAAAIDLVFQVEAGSPLIFDTLLIRITREGDTTNQPGLTNEGMLRNLLQLSHGDTVSLRKTSAYERKLRSTHVFNLVRLKDSTLDTSTGLTAMQFKAEERVPGEMELSAFYETQFGPGFAGSWTHSNLLGRLHEAHTLLSLAQKRQTLFLGYASLLFLSTPFRFDYDFTIDWQQESRFAETKPFFAGDFLVENQGRLSRAFGSHYRYVTGAEFRGRSELVDTTTRLRDFNLNWLNSAFMTYVDDALNPTRGSRFALTWGNGGPVFSSGELNVVQERHNWLELETAYYWPLFSWINLAWRLDGGRFFGSADFNAERFFLGGNRNVRSHNWRSVCPIEDPEGVCQQENLEPTYVLGSLELRLKPFPAKLSFKDSWVRHLPDFQIVPFIDYGMIWQRQSALRPEGRGRALGLGLRYVLFNIFNLRLDYAVDPYREASGEPLSRWVLDLAQAF
jgi:outer membrane protein assembly factor BamA